jgi:DNA-3-methyladenine glycosylase
MASPRLARAFFGQETLKVARELLGQRLVRTSGGRRLSGRVIETEAYVGSEDLGCHARHGLTARNESMWGPAGHAYVYFTYGMHWMLNIVTEEVGFPAAVLIRALLPEEGIPAMRRKRRIDANGRLTDGPAKLCQALGIDRGFDGMDLCRRGSNLFFERLVPVPDAGVTRGPRVGLNNIPEPWKSIPWRFRIKPDFVTRLFEKEP